MIGVLTAALAIVWAAGAEQPGGSRMTGKVDTGRTIFLEATVDASPEEVFRLWTTEDGISKFFAPKATIEPRLGGRFEMIFDPERDSEGDDSGTKGARILRFDPGRALSFEWMSFTRSGTDPQGPAGWPEERARRPIPTWVDLTLEPAGGKPGKTHVRLIEYGFGSGGKWEDSRQYFWRNWALVLGRLGALCAKGSS
jgi:uncharacterized protein YndB with AHSA1/START domain